MLPQVGRGCKRSARGRRSCTTSPISSRWRSWPTACWRSAPSPAMVHAEEEVEDFVAIASALVVNIGTLSPPWVAAMERAAARAGELGKPWVLDPVGCGATPYRTRTAAELAELRAERDPRQRVGDPGARRRRQRRRPGASTARTAPSEAFGPPAERWRASSGTVVAITGAVDQITDGERLLQVSNGDPRMTRVTALGCAASAMIGAFLAVEPDPLRGRGDRPRGLRPCRRARGGRAAGPGSLRGRSSTSWRPSTRRTLAPACGSHDAAALRSDALSGDRSRRSAAAGRSPRSWRRRSGRRHARAAARQGGRRPRAARSRRGRCRPCSTPLGVPLIVNDRVDVAVAAGAAGCHVGQSDLPAAAARALLGRDAILGVSLDAVRSGRRGRSRRSSTTSPTARSPRPPPSPTPAARSAPRVSPRCAR